MYYHRVLILYIGLNKLSYKKIKRHHQQQSNTYISPANHVCHVHSNYVFIVDDHLSIFDFCFTQTSLMTLEQKRISSKRPNIYLQFVFWFCVPVKPWMFFRIWFWFWTFHVVCLWLHGAHWPDVMLKQVYCVYPPPRMCQLSASQSHLSRLFKIYHHVQPCLLYGATKVCSLSFVFFFWNKIFTTLLNSVVHWCFILQYANDGWNNLNVGDANRFW